MGLFLLFAADPTGAGRDTGFRLEEHQEMTSCEAAKTEILRFMKLHGARTGSVLPPAPFAARTRDYTPEEHAQVDAALSELIAEGVLTRRERQYYLTQKGFDALYT